MFRFYDRISTSSLPLPQHSAPINHIAVDEDGEYIASCADDRKVAIIGLFSTKYNNFASFERPVKVRVTPD
jgi:WD40 repeat protein